MGVPFEALIPYGIIVVVRPFNARPARCESFQIDVWQMFGATGAGLAKIRHMQNGGKRARHSVDQWDRVT